MFHYFASLGVWFVSLIPPIQWCKETICPMMAVPILISNTWVGLPREMPMYSCTKTTCTIDHPFTVQECFHCHRMAFQVSSPMGSQIGSTKVGKIIHVSKENGLFVLKMTTSKYFEGFSAPNRCQCTFSKLGLSTWGFWGLLWKRFELWKRPDKRRKLWGVCVGDELGDWSNHK